MQYLASNCRRDFLDFWVLHLVVFFVVIMIYYRQLLTKQEYRIVSIYFLTK